MGMARTQRRLYGGGVGGRARARWPAAVFFSWKLEHKGGGAGGEGHGLGHTHTSLHTGARHSRGGAGHSAQRSAGIRADETGHARGQGPDKQTDGG